MLEPSRKRAAVSAPGSATRLAVRREDEKAAPPPRTFRAWLVLRLGPPPQPPRRHFSKSLNLGGSYRAVPASRRPG